MKKFWLIALVACGSVQAEEAASSNSVNFYAGASVASSWTSSDFKMDYEVNKTDVTGFPKAKPWANHKESSIGRVGAGFAVGVKKKFENDFFGGGEFNYTLSRAKHHHDFTFEEDQEDEIAPGKNYDIISRINVKHKDELSLALKFGKDCNSFDLYGIVGVTTKDVEIEYSVEADTDWTERNTGFDVSAKKRAWGAVFGLGGSKKITDKISYSLEYKYKLYNSAKKDVDCCAKSMEAFFNREHDKSDRHFKVKSDKHEISLGIKFNI